MRSSPVPENIEQTDSPPIDLKDPALAAFLAWLIPGLGHLYQGRRAKAALFFVCIMGLFVFGLYLGSSNEQCKDGKGKIGYGRAVYFSWKKGERTWAYLCQVCVGLPALPAMIQASRMNHHKPVWWGGFMAPPRPKPCNDANKDQPTLHDLHRVLNRYFELAWVFTTIAGLLNVLAIYDAWAGPMTTTPGGKKEESTESD
ncbi:MAG: hypothetical protein KKE86_08690 [Planctomycetes bacterium]|nr:hypothetical protein [Planctomycetota bacterium]MBU4399397.1 hypothetical protein [Planctomycetota bacterium]MCG2682537.1 hypothetical protein [Planctomycetales bacterium]